ncbi:MAG: hypothetical protein JRI97_12475 [Deltaproteobacteria bacterium]|nr:hypothetical protein [Deltaproteobacteria bacterium]
MRIRTLAKLALAGLAYIYAAKLADTLFHGVFTPAPLAGAVVGLNILAGVIHLLFFLALLRQFAPEGNRP